MANIENKDKTSSDNSKNSELHFEFNEQDIEIVSKIKDIIKNNRCNYSRMIKTKKHIDLFNWIMSTCF